MNIRLEMVRDTDFELLASWFHNPENNKWLISRYNLERYNQIIHTRILKKSDNFFCMVYDLYQPIGFVGLSLIDNLDKTGMIWYILGERSYAGQSVMTIAVNLLLEKAFTDLKLHSIQAIVAEKNAASLRVLEKNNFKRSGIQRESHFIEGGFQNRMCFDILQSEYRGMTHG